MVFRLIFAALFVMVTFLVVPVSAGDKLDTTPRILIIDSTPPPVVFSAPGREDCPDGVCPLPQVKATRSSSCSSGTCQVGPVRRIVSAPVRYIRRDRPVRTFLGRLFGIRSCR